MNAADLMTTPVLTVESDRAASDVASAMLEAGINSVVVVDEDCTPDGIVTSTDFVEMAAQTADETRTVGSYMTASVITAEPDEPVSTVAARMHENGISHMPVVDETDVVGIVTTSDFTAYVADGVDATEETGDAADSESA